MKVSAIVCAKNESPRIARVLEVLVGHPALSEVIVVDDGSTDDTSSVARVCGASVLRLPQNVGKGRAMLEGVRAATGSVVVFLDADLVGLCAEHVDALVSPVVSGAYAMVVGLRDYGRWTEATRELPLISGERALRRDLLLRCPEDVFCGFGVEVRLNDVVCRLGGKTATVVLSGLSIVLKWEKDPGRGVVDMLRMTAEVTKSMVAARRASAGDSLGSLGSSSSALTRHPFTPVEAPSPPSVTAECETTDCVMEKLSESLVRAAGPYARDELWTPEVQVRVGHVVGRHTARPLWVGACAGSFFMFGPAGLVVTSVLWAFFSEGG